MVYIKQHKLGSLIPSLAPLIILLGYFYQRPYLFTLILLSYLVAGGIFELLIKKDPSSPLAEIASLPENSGTIEYDFYYFVNRAILMTYLIILFLGLRYAQYQPNHTAWVFYAVSTSIAGAMSLNLCHEFLHSKYLVEKVISRMMSSLSFWSIHEYEHLFFHHNENIICTEKDKSYAQLNQSLYSFLYQSLIYNYIHSWQIQKSICQRNNDSFYNILKNTMLQTIGLSIIITICIFSLIGMYAGLYFVLQAMLSIFLFVATTYTQHYGLTRRKNENGENEPFTIMNVWSTDHFITSRFFFNLSHHAHHHKFQFCRYQNLRIIEKSPILPYGYILLLFTCAIPSLWYSIMNKRVKNVFTERDELEKAGIQL